MRIAIGLVLMGTTFGACSYINGKVGLKDDGPIEEFVEKQIENQIGIDIDLTPESEEK